MMEKKNTFTDFIDVAEHLVATGWGAKGRIGIEGGSAGGLLMGAVTNLRPDLWKAVIAHVPFVDVMNTMLDPSLPLTWRASAPPRPTRTPSSSAPTWSLRGTAAARTATRRCATPPSTTRS